MSLWDTVKDAGSNVLGQVTETGNDIWQSAKSGASEAAEVVADRWVRDKTSELQEGKQQAEAELGRLPTGQQTPHWDQGGTADPPAAAQEPTNQPQPPSGLPSWLLPAGGALLAGVVVWALVRR